jgi:hypothetical protein
MAWERARPSSGLSDDGARAPTPSLAAPSLKPRPGAGLAAVQGRASA